jgi:translation initiation factor IF-3
MLEENKITLEESIHLLNEFQEKAIQNILDKGRVDTNIIKDIKWMIHRDGASDQDKAYCRFNVNGKDEKFDFVLPHRYTIKQEIGIQIMDNIREKVAHILGVEFQKQQTKQLEYIYNERGY